jgi:hypothetical protein
MARSRSPRRDKTAVPPQIHRIILDQNSLSEYPPYFRCGKHPLRPHHLPDRMGQIKHLNSGRGTYTSKNVAAVWHVFIVCNDAHPIKGNKTFSQMSPGDEISSCSWENPAIAPLSRDILRSCLTREVQMKLGTGRVNGIETHVDSNLMSFPHVWTT